MTILDEIVSETRAALESALDRDALAAGAAGDVPPTRSLIQALDGPGPFESSLNLSENPLRRRNPAGIHASRGGLAYRLLGRGHFLSDQQTYFGGTLQDLGREGLGGDPRARARGGSPPTARNRGAGADAVLLIAECLLVKPWTTLRAKRWPWASMSCGNPRS